MRKVSGLFVLVGLSFLWGCGNNTTAKLGREVTTMVKESSVKPIEVRVSHVIDGDSFMYEVDNHPSGTVNLGCGVMAFKLEQEYGLSARLMLEELLPKGSQVTIYPIAMNTDGEINGLVINHKDSLVNYDVVTSGYAFINKEERFEPVCINEGPNGSIMDYLRSGESVGLNSGPFSNGKDSSGVTPPWEYKEN